MYPLYLDTIVKEFFLADKQLISIPIENIIKRIANIVFDYRY